MRRILSFALLAGVLHGCVDEPTPAAPEAIRSVSNQAVNVIVDGAHGGNERFFFLPPIAPDPGARGQFDPDVPVVVEVCRPAAGFCSNLDEPLVRVTMEARGVDGIRVDLQDEHYIANLALPTSLSVGDAFRLRVLVGGQELGHADLTVGTKDLRPQRTIPVQFRIENGAVALASFSIDGEVSSEIRNRIASASSPVAAIRDPGSDFDLAVGMADEPVLVLLADVEGNPILAAFYDGSDPVFSYATTAAALGTAMGYMAGLAVPTSDLLSKVESDAGFPVLLSAITNHLELGGSLADDELGGPIGVFLSSLTTTSAPALQLKAQASETEFRIGPTAILASDGPATAIALGNESFLSWRVTNESSPGDIISGTQLAGKEICVFCRDPLGQEDVRGSVAGINGDQTLHASLNYSATGLTFAGHATNVVYYLLGVRAGRLDACYGAIVTFIGEVFDPSIGEDILRGQGLVRFAAEILEQLTLNVDQLAILAGICTQQQVNRDHIDILLALLGPFRLFKSGVALLNAGFILGDLTIYADGISDEGFAPVCQDEGVLKQNCDDPEPEAMMVSASPNPIRVGQPGQIIVELSDETDDGSGLFIDFFNYHPEKILFTSYPFTEVGDGVFTTDIIGQEEGNETVTVFNSDFDPVSPDAQQAINVSVQGWVESASGSWYGVTASNGFEVLNHLELSVSQSGGTVTGSGRLYDTKRGEVVQHVSFEGFFTKVVDGDLFRGIVFGEGCGLSMDVGVGFSHRAGSDRIGLGGVCSTVLVRQ